MPDRVVEVRESLQDCYAFEGEPGRGGMATVYLARDLKHERPVREIRLAARRQHPHITVPDSCTAAGRLWFTLPFVEGESLRDRLPGERQLPMANAVRIQHELAWSSILVGKLEQALDHLELLHPRFRSLVEGTS